MAYGALDYKVIIAGTNVDNGDYWEIGFGYLADSALAGANEYENCLLIASEFQAQHVPELLLMLASNVNLDTISCRKMAPPAGPMATVIENSTGALSACETIGNGAQITWFGENDPILDGRTYFPGIPNDSLDGGNWDAAFLTACSNFINAIVNPLVIGGVDVFFAVQSVQIGVPSNPVYRGQTKSIPGTQRRRLRR